MAMMDMSRFTDRARTVMKLANLEAQKLNHEYIGTEHVLLGLVREGIGVAANVLKSLDVSLERIQKEILKVVIAGPEIVTMGKLPTTPRMKKVLEHAAAEAISLGHGYVGTEHLLLGLMIEKEGVACQILINLGLNLTLIRQQVIALLGKCDPRELESDPAMKAIHETILVLETELRKLRAIAAGAIDQRWAKARTELSEKT